MLVRSGMAVHSLFLDWTPGPARFRLTAAARRTADLYATTHVEFAYPVDWMKRSEQLGRVRMPFTVFAAVALGAQYAASLDVLWLATGRRRGSVEAPDGSTDQMQQVLNQSRISEKLVLLAPVFDLDDDGVDAKAKELGVDLAGSASCLEPTPCGACLDCRRRRRFGYEAG
jgi:7-cyano-7-deazaguanine synthase in queuosine biosynthesis